MRFQRDRRGVCELRLERDSHKVPSTYRVSDTAILDVSVVIPTHNRRDSLRRVLEALGSQTVAPNRYEAIVVCDGCTDGTASMCRGLVTPYRLRIIVQPKQMGPAATRNRAVEESDAELIVFLDDDVVPDPELIRQHLQIHDRDDHAVAIGPLLAPPRFALNPWTRWEASMLLGQYRDMEAGRWLPGPRQFYTGNASVRREHLRAAGGFDPAYRRAEDVELAYRLEDLSLTFYFKPDAKGWHFARRSLRSWLGIPRAYGEADIANLGRGRRWILSNMAWEFHCRRRPLQRMARVCIGRPIVLGTAIGIALVVAHAATWASWQRTAQAGYSAVFNLLYWDTISRRLGGRSVFWELIASQKPARGYKPIRG
jgi:GT2 family glycosyltransferase